jgi:hypothetical protein
MTPERHAALVQVCAFGATTDERRAADLELTLDLMARLEASDYRCPRFEPLEHVHGGMGRAQLHAGFGRLCSPFAFNGGFIALVHTPREPVTYPWIPMPEAP